MAVDPGSAADSLSDVARIERKTREAARYSGGAYFLIWWGALTSIAYLLAQFVPDWRPGGWGVLGLGVAGSVVIRYLRWRFRAAGTGDKRMIIAMLVLLGFGALWLNLFFTIDSRGLAAFWPTLFMLGFVIGGLWVGRVFIAIGLVVTALTVAGYLWSGAWFDLWMAVVNGGGLIAGGWFLRRMGLAR